MGASRPERDRAAQRRQQAFRLRVAGHTFREIGQTLGVSSAVAYRYVRKVLDEYNAETKKAAGEHVSVQQGRLEAAVKAIWPRVVTGDTQAVSVLVRLLGHEARLLGLDAPAKVDITQRIRQMAASLGLDPDEAVREAERVIKELND